MRSSHDSFFIVEYGTSQSNDSVSKPSLLGSFLLARVAGQFTIRLKLFSK